MYTAADPPAPCSTRRPAWAEMTWGAGAVPTRSAAGPAGGRSSHASDLTRSAAAALSGALRATCIAVYRTGVCVITLPGHVVCSSLCARQQSRPAASADYWYPPPAFTRHVNTIPNGTPHLPPRAMYLSVCMSPTVRTRAAGSTSGRCRPLTSARFIQVTFAHAFRVLDCVRARTRSHSRAQTSALARKRVRPEESVNRPATLD
jgi:hypothetical protein